MFIPLGLCGHLLFLSHKRRQKSKLRVIFQVMLSSTRSDDEKKLKKINGININCVSRSAWISSGDEVCVQLKWIKYGFFAQIRLERERKTKKPYGYQYKAFAVSNKIIQIENYMLNAAFVKGFLHAQTQRRSKLFFSALYLSLQLLVSQKRTLNSPMCIIFLLPLLSLAFDFIELVMSMIYACTCRSLPIHSFQMKVSVQWMRIILGSFSLLAFILLYSPLPLLYA